MTSPENRNDDLFSSLKKGKRSVVKKVVPHTIFFQLKFDELGAFVSVVNEKGQEVDPDYEFYNGSTRELLKTIQNIKERSLFRIDWMAPDGRIYLHEHEYLLWQLKANSAFVDENFMPLAIIDEPTNITVEITPLNELLQANILIHHQGKKINALQFITESHVYQSGSIYRVEPIGDNFHNLHLFETNISPQKLERYLSLLFSYFNNIQLRYENYKIVEGPEKQTQPALVIEKVDADKSLYLRVSAALTGFDSNFLDEYEISKIASVHDLEKKIFISDVVYEEMPTCFADIEHMLKKHRRELKGAADYFVDENLIIIEQELAKEFVHKELTHLISRFVIFGAENLKYYKIRTVRPKLNLQLSHGIDFLEGDADLEIEGEMISLFDALTQFKKNNYILLNDGTHAIINKDYINKLQRLFRKHEDKVKISFFDLPIIDDLIGEKIANETLKQSREIFLGFNNLHKEKVRYPQLKGDLRSYQKQGFKWVRYLHKHGIGGCLADDMGLGKTIQAIAILSTIYPKEKLPSLVIMPKTLLFNWGNEVEKFNPKLSFYIYHGPGRNLKSALRSNLIFTTYATVRNDIQKLQELEFYYIILDESQNIKNLNSQSSKAVMLLHSKHRLALSGTPIENNLGELYSLFRFLNPSMFGTIQEFNRNYAAPIQKEDDKEALNELKNKIYPFILRRLKKDVLKDLPDKVEQVLYVDMSPTQRIFYEKRRKFYYDTVKMQIAQNGIRKSQFFILQALSELRQIASVPEAVTNDQIVSPKREVLSENIMEVVANDHKVLVFANYLHALECIGEDLDKNSIDFLTMTGATRDRQALVERFQNDEQYKVFLMTLKTGGLGLNLTAAEYIFIYDPWWNLAAENQAIDRTHRIGQDKAVFSYKIIMRKSIEEKILELQRIKRQLFDNLIRSDGASIKSLNEEDVDFILGK